CGLLAHCVLFLSALRMIKTKTDSNVPEEWVQLLENAQEYDVLDGDAARRWGKDFARQARKNAEMAAAREEAFRREQLGLDSSDEEDMGEY
ncbi:hypothetical protein Sste5346_004867, partial [Sporothrix stenoceras]